MKTKFKSTLPLTRRLLSSVLCFGAVILICSTAPAQNLFVSGGGNINELTPTGTRSIFASGLNGPDGLAFDSAGNLFVADNGAIYKFTAAGVRTTFAAAGLAANGLVFDKAGNLFVAAG